ncbi:MAG: cytochrome-c peroxidase [Bacteroidota bacterium]|nr:cytochrome-c peroxidase [Bacteroidota bacterium]
MKRFSFLTLLLSGIVAALSNCRHTHVDNNQPSDSDSLYTNTHYTLTIPARFPLLTNPYKDSMSVEGVELGRILFYDKHLSLDGQKSCATCHNVLFALSDSGNAKSTNEFQQTVRNAPALENLAWASQLFWDGRSGSLALQAQDAYQHELGLVVQNGINYLKTDSTYTRLFRKSFGRPGDITAPKIYNAIQQFVMSAISGNSKLDKYLRGEEQLTPSELMGYQIFLNETGDCFHCHASSGGSTLLFTDNLFRNNGLDSAVNVSDFKDAGRGAITGSSSDYGKFKDPSLRNIALTGPYMHDGRYTTLQQVINFYSDSTKLSPTIDNTMLLPNHANGGLHLSTVQKQALVDFLYTLTDTSFIHNPGLQNPF